MKKLLLLVGVFSTGTLLFAQQRTVFVEGFSQASCGPCAAQNPALNALLDQNKTKVVSIKYQTSWPGVDPMNAQNPTEVQSRVNYYGINGVPDRILDGVNTDITQGAIDTRYAVTAPIQMTASHTISADLTKASFQLTVSAQDAWNPTNTVIHIAMVEDLITFNAPPGTNGEKVFHNVMRKMYPNANGTPLDASLFANPNGSQTITLTDLTIPSYVYDRREIGFVAWVQNNTTKEVYQASYSVPVELANYATVETISSGSTVFSCTNELANASITFKNGGTADITAANLNYKIDNGTVVTVPINATIAVGGTYTYTIPTMASTSGSHKLTAWLTDLNSVTGALKLGEKSSTYATISDAGIVNFAGENFTSTTFPYTNYFTFSSTDSDWKRSTAGAGSMIFGAYNFPSGNTGEVTLAPINMASTSIDTLTFDVAYAQYQAENDKLQVLVSKDCGATWTTVFDKAGNALKTAAPTTSSFVPTAAQWRKEKVSLVNFTNDDKVFIKFKGTSNYGNNIYVDNVKFMSFVGLNEVEKTANFSVYPNPTSSNATVVIPASSSNGTVQVIDNTGRILFTQTTATSSNEQKVTIATQNLNAGTYFVVVSLNNTVETLPLVVQ